MNCNSHFEEVHRITAQVYKGMVKKGISKAIDLSDGEDRNDLYFDLLPFLLLLAFDISSFSRYKSFLL